jgi:GntR family transcriptional regulator
MSQRTLRIDLSVPEPAYEQIVRSLRSLLVSGEFEAGEQLPPVRQLATDLGVNHNTVAEAYRMLAREGWLELRQGRGATVLLRSKPRPSRGSKDDFARRLRELVVKAIADGLGRSAIADALAAEAASVRKEPS